MVRTLPFARPSGTDNGGQALSLSPGGPQNAACLASDDDGQSVGLSPGRLAAHPTTLTCEHRTVSRDGRIVCKKIVDGQAEVSPSVCRQCPSRAVNCRHLRFSLRLTSPSPLLVRFNGRTELWDDGPAELPFGPWGGLRARGASTARPVPSE